MNLELVPYSLEYLDAFARWRTQAATVRHNPLKSLSMPELQSMLEAECADLGGEGDTGYRWFVRVDGAVVGSVSLKNVNVQMAYAEIGYGLCESVHGRGVGTEAVRHLVDRAFGGTSLRRLVAYVHDQNEASCRLLARLGFAREGVLREHYVIGGQPADEVVYGLLRREWEGWRRS
ncbi:MAG: GNAT family protein [Pseudomonadota bacterium]|nr:GNAT family protein [Pseudomonadota bacterium]